MMPQEEVLDVGHDAQERARQGAMCSELWRGQGGWVVLLGDNAKVYRGVRVLPLPPQRVTPDQPTRVN
jgi:hypothetical protein